MSLNIPCTGSAFRGKNAWYRLLDYAEAYFSNGFSSTTATGVIQRVQATDKLPIFLQRPGHSLSIVGILRLKSGERKLLTFDPAWQPPSVMMMPMSTNRLRTWKMKWLLKRYTKSQRYLRRYSAFETLSIERNADNPRSKCRRSMKLDCT